MHQYCSLVTAIRTTRLQLIVIENDTKFGLRGIDARWVSTNRFKTRLSCVKRVSHLFQRKELWLQARRFRPSWAEGGIEARSTGLCAATDLQLYSGTQTTISCTGLSSVCSSIGSRTYGGPKVSGGWRAAVSCGHSQLNLLLPWSAEPVTYWNTGQNYLNECIQYNSN